MVDGKRRKNIILICAAVVVLVLGTVGTWFFFGHTNTTPLPRQLIAQANFPLYYPSALPAGYALKANSASGDNDIVFYTLTDSTGKNDITITMQAALATFDASKEIGSSPIPTTITPAGTLYNLSSGGSSSYMLVTGKTLLYLRSPVTIEGKIMTTITNSLTQIKSE